MISSGCFPGSGVRVSRALVACRQTPPPPAPGTRYRLTLPFISAYDSAPLAAHLPITASFYILWGRRSSSPSHARLTDSISFERGSSLPLCVLAALCQPTRGFGPTKTEAGADPRGATGAREGGRGPRDQVGLDSSSSKTQSVLNCPAKPLLPEPLARNAPRLMRK